MHRLNKSQKDKISQFKSITGANDRVAQSCLQVADWVTDVALDNFYSGSPQPDPSPVASGSGRQKNIEALYQRFKDPDQDAILADGITQFCSELEVDPADIVMLVISQHLNAASMGEYTKTEFEEGMEELGCDTMVKLKRKLPQLRSEMQDPRRLKVIWDYAYLFSREKGQKCVQLDTAIAMWQLLFTHMHWPLGDDWCSFVQHNHKRAISKDTWTQLFEFIKQVKPDLSNFDSDASAWPYLIDEFVEHLKKERAEGTPMEM
ncbi:hypothetical protein WJX73_000465 [Symbiochloris irregularis]|uniref:Defective in cullin neddylation protein n=1 Tax=Symbiochloris irregularis TaxID=706552 RepID=A0AAW1NPH7_9CHLO